VVVVRSQLERDLNDLIRALDRRLPGADPRRETSIVRAAANLRAQAVRRLTELATEHASEVAPSTGPPRRRMRVARSG
jgi:hypothetical protein